MIDKLKALLTAKFMLAMAAIFLAAGLVWYGKAPATTFASVVASVVPSFPDARPT